jgi:hypothetical protein
VDTQGRRRKNLLVFKAHPRQLINPEMQLRSCVCVAGPESDSLRAIRHLTYISQRQVMSAQISTSAVRLAGLEAWPVGDDRCRGRTARLRRASRLVTYAVSAGYSAQDDLWHKEVRAGGIMFSFSDVPVLGVCPHATFVRCCVGEAATATWRCERLFVAVPVTAGGSASGAALW